MSTATVTIALSTIIACYVFFFALLHLTQDKSEPPVVSRSIPFVSPLLGMVRWGMDYYSHMRRRHLGLPIYTLRLPGTRIYVVKAARVAMGVGKDTVAILERDMITKSGFVNGMAKSIHPTLSNGPALDALSAKVFEVFNGAMGEFTAPTTISMFQWIDKQIMLATTDAVYGSSNPMRDDQNLAAWHNYHPAIMFFMLDILPPKLFFKSAIQGREYLVKSFAKYYKDGSYQKGSAYIQEFTRHCISQKIPHNDIPRLLMGTVFNTVANTTPSAFWVIYRIFSDSTVLQECRDEVEAAIQHNENGTSTIDLNLVVNSCPILLSTYNEVFRYHGMANSVRFVSEDHMLNGRYLVKKGGLVMVSARSQHSNPAIWGDNVDRFYHKRFMKQQNGGKRVNPVALRGFGGGTTLCPGRHFATSEILMLAALMLARFDVQPSGGKPWVLPSTAKSSQAEAMEQPDNDINIEVLPRPGTSGRAWRVAFSGR